MTLSCFGNATLGELSDIAILNFNVLKNLDLRPKLVDGGPCSIPGLQLPNLPNFAIPSIAIPIGLPPFPTFCLLPPFPGLPSLSLPGITIPIPPLPFLPPIPLPFFFSLPTLPTLPSFDLGSLSFLCGLINIDLPILDPFASLNDAIGNLNNQIGALNKFLNICAKNQELQYSTEVPYENFPTLPNGSLTIADLETLLPETQQTGLKLPQPVLETKIASANRPQRKGEVATKSEITRALQKITIDPEQGLEQLAIALANEGVIVAEPSIITTLEKLLAKLDTPSADKIYDIITDNQIVSPDGFIGFKIQEIEKSLSNSNNSNSFLNDLINNGLLKKEFKDSADQALRGLKFGKTSALSYAIRLNSMSIPYKNGKSLQRLTESDIIRSLYFNPITLPLSGEKYISSFIATKTIDPLRSNRIRAVDKLLKLPEILKPSEFVQELKEITVGIAASSQKAQQQALVFGVTNKEIDQVRQAENLRSFNNLEDKRLVRILAQTSLPEFQRKMEDLDIPLIFPASILEMIPLLSIAFEYDDQHWYDLLSFFNIPVLFYSLSDLAIFLKQESTGLLSEQGQSTFDQTDKYQEYLKLVETITNISTKTKITFPTDITSNKKLASAISLELRLDLETVANSFSSYIFNESEEVAFYLWSLGIMKSRQTSYSLDISKIMEIVITPPTGIVSDLKLESIQLSLETNLVTGAGVIEKTILIIVDGKQQRGTSVIYSDNQYSLSIIIGQVDDLIRGFQAIQNIDFQISYQTVVSSQLEQVPNYLVKVNFG